MYRAEDLALLPRKVVGVFLCCFKFCVIFSPLHSKKQVLLIHSKKWVKVIYVVKTTYLENLFKAFVSWLEVQYSVRQGDQSRASSLYMTSRRWLYNVCIALSSWIKYALPFHLKLFAACAVKTFFVRVNKTVWWIMMKSSISTTKGFFFHPLKNIKVPSKFKKHTVL